ncbi:Helix-hairpin-helix motif-containing protein [Micromonospora viridifaciens]|uniref:Helix-hairpin-helix motif-containing protein n=1 Tax=Micromonospora viridifaciens TaxID=1881 RepID=A0A1C4ZLU9_MICVI|nr:helix-hairpin-helix domain-containing protein [Micromonospora viridifaciens]SCF34050.1 Helix-hairpin-helix motif-containing protein [Micromonospora viridifaciens]
MSSAPDQGWGGPPPVPGPAAPAASLGWRLLHSWWLLLPALGFSCLGGIGFLYVGLRARRPAWWIPGIVYLVLGWAAFIVVGESDRESALSDWAAGAVLAIWIGSILHAALINPAWLRWRAGYRPWYQQPAGAASWPGGQDPSGPLAPPPAAAPGVPDQPSTAWQCPPGSPAYPPTTPAYPPASSAYPPASPGYAPAAPAPDPTFLAQPPADFYGPGPAAAPVPAPGQPASPTLIDVNTAGPAEFAALPGFDAQRAHQLLNERDRRGGFSSLAEFAGAANLAPHEYARLRDLLVCAPPVPPAPGQPGGRVLDV